MFNLFRGCIITNTNKSSGILFIGVVLNFLFLSVSSSYSDAISDRDIDEIFYWTARVNRIAINGEIAGRPQPQVFYTTGSFETLENGNIVLNDYKLNDGSNVVNCGTDSMYIEILYLYHGTEGIHDRGAIHWSHINVTIKSRESGEIVGSGKSVSYSPWPYINRIFLEHEMPNIPGIYDVYLQPEFNDSWDYKNKFKKNNVKLSFIVKPWSSECGNIVSLLPPNSSSPTKSIKNATNLRWIDNKNLSIESDLSIGKIQIYNANGSVVHSVGNVVGKRYIWDTDNISQGLYMISFGNGNYSKVLIGRKK